MNQEQGNPFEVGDVVYHAYYKELKITQIDKDDINTNILTSQGWFNYVELSFEPWPKPVHVRPIKVGWWVYLTEHNNRLVVWVEKGGISAEPKMLGSVLHPDRLLKFLSDDQSYFSKN